MTPYTLRWPQHPGAELYQLYRSTAPGAPYELLATVTEPQATVVYDATPRNPRVLTARTGATQIAWDAPMSGLPWSFKAVPVVGGIPLWSPSPDIVWLADALPIGAIWEDSWGITPDPQSLHGTSSWRFTKPGISPRHEWRLVYFTSAPQPHHHLLVWVYLIEPPDALYVAFRIGSSWEHRAYFGYDVLPFGPDGTPAKRYAGELPAPGCWACLVIPLAGILEAAPNGMAIGIASRNPEAPVAFLLDTIAISQEPVLPPPAPLIGVHGYVVERTSYDMPAVRHPSASLPGVGLVLPDRSWKLTSPDLTDTSARDFSRQGPEDQPTLSAHHDWQAQALVLSWAAPEGSGTTYTYTVATVGTDGRHSSAVPIDVTVNDAWHRADVYVDTQPINGQPPVATDLVVNQFAYAPVQPETTYHVRVVLKDGEGLPVFTLERTYRTGASSRLDAFILGVSRLA